MSQQQITGSLAYRPPESRPGDLGEHEIWWAEHQEALEAAGYLLRSRYRPNWIPSWRGTDKFYRRCEDGQSTQVSALHAFLVALPTNLLRCAWVWTQLESLMGGLWC